MTINTTLTFDDENDKLLIGYLSNLKEQHKVGDFLTYCVKNYNTEAKFQSSIKQTSTQKQELTVRLNKIHEIALKCYCLLGVGERIGLEEQVNQTMLSEFILYKQIKELQNLFGVEYPFDYDIKDVTQYADEVVEYIIHSYDGILNQVKQSTVTISNQSKEITQVKEQSKEEQDNKQNNKDNKQDNQQSEIQPIKFGEDLDNESLDDLLDFAGY